MKEPRLRDVTKNLMKCIVGLGNPGNEYKNTRHNAGFLAVDYLQQVWKFPEFTSGKHSALESAGLVAWERVVLLKPTTYMNLSGRSVSSFRSFFKLPLEDLLIISDDIDQEFGKIRFRQKWTSGGQNWIKSIIEHLGSENISRIKIGIWRDPRYEVSDWVLSKLTSSELEELEQIFSSELEERVNSWINAEKR